MYNNGRYGTDMFWEGDSGSLLQGVGSGFAFPMPKWSQTKVPIQLNIE